LVDPVTTETTDHPGGYAGAIAEFYESAAARLAAHLDAGRDVVLLAEGDPLFFSSYMHMHKRLATRYEAHIVPGVTSVSAASSAVGRPLVEGDEVLTVLPGTLPPGELAERLAARGMDALITDGFRSIEEQNKIFAQGRTTPGRVVTQARGGESNHNYGMAVDLYPVIGGHVFTEPTAVNKQRFVEIQRAIIDEAEGLGLFSGSHFGKLGDMPHVQLLGEDVFNAKHKALPIFNANGGSYDAVWNEARKLL